MKKIKGSLSKPEPSALVAIAALSLCALLPLRVYQVTSLIEPETGFFKETNFTIPLFYGIGAAVIFLLMVLSFLNSKANSARNVFATSKSLGIVAAVTAMTIIFNAVNSFSAFTVLNSKYSAFEHGVYTSYLTKSGAAPLALEALFAVLTAFFFIIYAISCFKKSSVLSSCKIISAAPAIWAICRIVYRFLEKISFVNISDLLLELIMTVFMIMFFIAFAQVVTNVSPQSVAWRLFGCGLPAAITAFIVSVPRIFLMVIGHSELIVNGYGFEPCDLALAVFIPLFLYQTTTVKAKENN